jgi:glycosyltransferase involved in cell wall biosynthesis
MSEVSVMNSSEHSAVVVASQAQLEPQPTRVLHVHAGNLYGGIETMLLTQTRERDRCPGLETSFALCFDGRFSEELTDAGATVHRLGQVRIRQPFSVRRARQNLRELLQRAAFDTVVMHSCWSQAVFGPAVRAQSMPPVPLVFYMHGPANGRHWLERWARRTQPDLVLCNSNFTASTASLLFPEVRTKTIYCPVAPSTPESLDAIRDTIRKETRAELNTSAAATVIIQVSRMEAGKGQPQHLEALSLLKDLPNWVCWQVGGAQRPSETEYFDELNRQAARLGIVERLRFLGQRSDVPRLLAAADVYCQPNSGAESFGITFIEALYAGLPVVTTALGGVAEIVDDSCGVLVPVADAAALSAVLRRLITSEAERTKLGSAGPARAQRLCDPEKQLAEFRSALSGATPARSF